MNLGLSEELVEVREKIRTFVEEKVDPVEREYHDEVSVGDRWSHTPRQDEIHQLDERQGVGILFERPEFFGGEPSELADDARFELGEPTGPRFEAGTDTVTLRPMMAFRIRVRKSAMGSVIDIGSPNLPA